MMNPKVRTFLNTDSLPEHEVHSFSIMTENFNQEVTTSARIASVWASRTYPTADDDGITDASGGPLRVTGTGSNPPYPQGLLLPRTRRRAPPLSPLARGSGICFPCPLRLIIP